uniref:Ribosomal protein L9 domain-containing protein n=1 Tax=Chromera velia CCMP2878 TaxID=1169474 RepID=A0A0G4I8E3_9ALVE|eukprot:Cvel_11905.t1-p1 / transcript=Cvel_11905.t1 / gene=Cvel_11905 / organism=Chromera_velia_CCMP2878 / gene_product=50S ribosomal protein L9, putative / transcript_product=50S ribosomal protein L9, putative / location=Cvel_scaffold762:9719-15093(+) / protein_length=353 / sequence_SO=supercontig / SO=protein_coding / is_pseudo=false
MRAWPRPAASVSSLASIPACLSGGLHTPSSDLKCGPILSQCRFFAINILKGYKNRREFVYPVADKNTLVVLLEHVPGVGRKGQIVSVRRGFGRHVLVPEGKAVWATWETIDEFADRDLVDDATAIGISQDGVRESLPFEWINHIRLVFQEPTHDSEPSLLLEAIDAFSIVRRLSEEHELDVLPADVSFPRSQLSGAVSLSLSSPPSSSSRSASSSSSSSSLPAQAEGLEEEEGHARGRGASLSSSSSSSSSSEAAARRRNIATTGVHQVSLRIPLKDRVDAPLSFLITVDVRSAQAERRAEERRRMMEAELRKRPSFDLSQGQVREILDEEEEEEEGEEGEEKEEGGRDEEKD